MPHMLTIREFTAQFGVSRSTLYRLWAQNSGPCTVRIGRRVLIPLDRAREWARSLETASQ